MASSHLTRTEPRPSFTVNSINLSPFQRRTTIYEPLSVDWRFLRVTSDAATIIITMLTVEARFRCNERKYRERIVEDNGSAGTKGPPG